MIIKAKQSIYKKSNIIEGVLIDAEIRDIHTHFNRFNNSLNFVFGVFQNIENELILVDKINLKISDDNKRTGLVQLPDLEGTGDTTVAIEEYYIQNGTLEGVTVLDYGFPSVTLTKTFFSGGNLDNPEINPTNDLAKEWLLNTLIYDGKKINLDFQFE